MRTAVYGGVRRRRPRLSLTAWLSSSSSGGGSSSIETLTAAAVRPILVRCPLRSKKLSARVCVCVWGKERVREGEMSFFPMIIFYESKEEEGDAAIQQLGKVFSVSASLWFDTCN